MLKIVVKQSHIDRGISCNGAKCPIALATRGRKKVDVHVSMISIKVGDKRYKLTKKMLEFIQRFDFGTPVKPTTFTVTEYPAGSYY